MKKFSRMIEVCLILLLAVALILPLTGCEKGNDSIVEPPPPPPPQEASTDNGLLLNLNEDKSSYSVVGMGSCTGPEIIIPGSYQNVPITHIAKRVFYNQENILKVTIPDSVTDIETSAFNGCGNLIVVTFGNGLKKIGSNAFYQCTSLQNVTIPDSVSLIDEAAFAGCTNIQQLVISNPETSIANNAFYGCDLISDATVPMSVLSAINKTNLRTVVLTTGEAIEDEMFKSWWGTNNTLESIVLPDGLKTIGAEAFSSCSALKNVTIPDSIQSIGELAFNGCNKLEYHTYNQGQYLGNPQNPCVVLMRISGESVTSFATAPGTKIIYERVAADCLGSLESITISEQVRYICNSAFSSCIKLTALTIPGNVKCIGEKAFYYCTQLKNVIIEDGVKSIEMKAFDSCERLESVTLPKTLERIGIMAFYFCENLESFHFNGSIEEWNEMTGNVSLRETSAYTVYCNNGTIPPA